VRPRTRPASDAIAATTSFGQLAVALEAAAEYDLMHRRTAEIIERVHGTIVGHFDDACDRAQLTAAQRKALWGRQFCNPYSLLYQP